LTTLPAVALPLLLWRAKVFAVRRFIQSTSSDFDSGLGNMMATVFPLFTKQMFDAIGYNWANTIFALVALVMAPIPFALFFYGPKIRLRSKFSRMVVENQK
jgi:hypothetical protein